MEWQPIATAPEDGSWFMTAVEDEGPESYEIGRYEPTMWPTFEEAGGGLYRKVDTQILKWRGFDNFHRATHWQPLPPPPAPEAGDVSPDVGASGRGGE